MGWLFGFACGMVIGMIVGRQAAYDEIVEWWDGGDDDTVSLDDLKRELGL